MGSELFPLLEGQEEVGGVSGGGGGSVGQQVGCIGVF